MPNDQLSPKAQRFLDIYKNALEAEKNYDAAEEEKVTVHQVSGKIAFFYEKLRNSVDYKEEHLLRKNAIKRILKRRVMTEKNEADVAKFLVYELVRARYLPDKKIPVRRIKDIELIIQKYTFLLNNMPSQKGTKKTQDEALFEWIIGIASCEIEEGLVPHGKENAIVNFAREVMEEKIKVQEGLNIKPDLEKELIYVAVIKNLNKADTDMIRYRLFITKHPEWIFAPSEDTISKMAPVMGKVVSGVDKIINHKHADDFIKAVRTNRAYLTILQDVIFKNSQEVDRVFSHHYRIEDAVKETCVKEYRVAHTKLNRAAKRSIVYIFITKVVLALIIELPFDKYIVGHINYFALGVNILFPPILMALAVMKVSVPSKKNTELIVTGIKNMLYGEYGKPMIIKRAPTPNAFFLTAFRFLYLVVFLASFGLIIFTLNKLGFNFISMGLFCFFLSVVSYFSIRIRQNARELQVVKKKEGTIGFMTELFFMPILQVGKWLSAEMSNLNFFVYIMDFIIEAPFKTFVDIFEQWIYYLKEEKDKIE
ncbi:MAG: hypothetical protein WC180_04200 [Candidatus Paceibacterota bacterium]